MDYEIVAFYRHKESEVSAHAEQVCATFGLGLRYEKVPGTASAIAAILNEKSVICLFNWDFLGTYRLMKYVYYLSRPSLIVRSDWTKDGYLHLKIPVGYLQENKEKVVWANFLQKHNANVDIELLVPKEEDSGISTMVNDNLFFIKKILANSEAHFKETFAEEDTGTNLKNTFKTADNSMILVMRSFRLFTFYIPFRLRMFVKYGHTPTLIIPRDDELYIPCH